MLLAVGEPDVLVGGGVIVELAAVEEVVDAEPVAPAKVVFADCEPVETEPEDRGMLEEVAAKDVVFNDCELVEAAVMLEVPLDDCVLEKAVVDVLFPEVTDCDAGILDETDVGIPTCSVPVDTAVELALIKLVWEELDSDAPVDAVEDLVRLTELEDNAFAPPVEVAVVELEVDTGNLPVVEFAKSPVPLVPVPTPVPRLVPIPVPVPNRW